MRNTISSPGAVPRGLSSAATSLRRPGHDARPDVPRCPGPTRWALQKGQGWSVLPRFLPDKAATPARPLSIPAREGIAPFPAQPLSTARAGPPGSPRPKRAGSRPGRGVPHSPGGGGGAACPGGAAGPPGESGDVSPRPRPPSRLYKGRRSRCRSFSLRVCRRSRGGETRPQGHVGPGSAHPKGLASTGLGRGGGRGEGEG